MADILETKLWFVEKNLPAQPHPLTEVVKKLFLASDFACKLVPLVHALIAKDACSSLLNREDYFAAINQLSLQTTQPNYMRDLRQFRNTHFLRLMILDLAHKATTQAIMQSWSDCADAIILHALSYSQQALNSRYGIPRQSLNEPVQLYTLAMGKLGGRELNYSSDIDLIFTFSKEGTTDGPEPIANTQYFNKVVQLFIQLMQQLTMDGFVFRVDLRLRPNGDSGPLVSSLSAMETYYQEQGRDWERYAMVKGRVITQNLDNRPSWYERLILPFVYRRYVDYSVIESLRSMKSLIEREIKLNPSLNDIKRGQGGIREIEFIIQNFQLIRGGRLPQLQQQNALLALEALKQEKLLPRGEVLKQGYLFLRKLENSLQSLADQQTHSLPVDPMKQAQISLMMGATTWDALMKQVYQYRRIISYSFHSVLGRVEAYEDENRVLAKQLAGLWQGHIEQEMAINLLTSLGYRNATHCAQMIHTFRHSPRCRRLTQTARLRLDRFMELLLTNLIHCDKTDEVLLQMISMLENILGRSAYLALLTENPKALKELTFWFANSPFISSLFLSQPFLLDILLEEDAHWQVPTHAQLKRLLEDQLSQTKDMEQQSEQLREFKLRHWLMAARAELHGFCDAVRIGQFLSDIAEIIVAKVFSMAYNQLYIRHPHIKQIKSGFAIVAYGKLGSRELNYASDLDLVFLHSAKPEEEAAVTLLTQKILHMLTTRSRSGILYTVDTRLRPSGGAGLLVSHVDAFIDYQLSQAWTWEHQAMVKARLMVGTLKMKQVFLGLKKSVLTLPRNATKLQEEVQTMRSKIEYHQETGHLRKVRSELLDLEFLIQYLILKLGKPDFASYTHTLSHIQQLHKSSGLTKKQTTILKKAYKRYHQILHQNLLQPNIVQLPEIPNEVSDICRDIYLPNFN
ncbi:MAG: bifunctional [glutamate--ammonia ligase]-adenylyl-L-tyrosine phosphorylase/[glutamate--ammonia-ligase] adenylyltransferase [Legionella sp.]|nr:bifunctional [glutamate--ammonia ligase]-adenylyl-L-tyrosine phosphorylase/[glutamate--ammonia-ligase] adenylyltransferase [Legionella sp.]